AASSRLHEIDMDNIPFGRVFSDHMLVARYENGQWQQAEITPYDAIPLHPSLSALNYGQSIFEGMKAHRNPEGEILLFRPDENFNRINYSAARMCMPQIPEEIFMDGLKQLINMDRKWVPTQEQGSLYIRPLYFATDEYIGVKASENYMLVIFTGPVGPYYPEPVSLIVNPEFTRAARGGTGSAKAAGNYGAAMYPDKLAKEKGYNNVLWLDAKENTYIEECGTMNVFFVLDGVVVTPNLSGTILQGITRASLITLLKSNGYRVEERPISIYEVQAAYREGRLQEAFGAGTAATVAHIARIGFNGSDMILPPVEGRKVSNWVGKRLADIKYGSGDDTFGWTVTV
ncbi:MAG: branched-chain amino acid aminotransferase, partial [Bacteroidota bacterium]